jgi:hypothetical protein
LVSPVFPLKKIKKNEPPLHQVSFGSEEKLASHLIAACLSFGDLIKTYQNRTFQKPKTKSEKSLQQLFKEIYGSTHQCIN